MLREDAEAGSRLDDVRTERPRPRTGDRHVVPAPLEPGRQTDNVTLGATDVERIAHEEDSQPKIGPSEPTDGSSLQGRAWGRGPDHAHRTSNACTDARCWRSTSGAKLRGPIGLAGAPWARRRVQLNHWRSVLPTTTRRYSRLSDPVPPLHYRVEFLPRRGRPRDERTIVGRARSDACCFRRNIGGGGGRSPS